ncbi:MAG: SDR family NAD(P)-dependent oxidoreductase [Cohaesibacter sp.]|jgi:short-subunit dehydrogenase|nr:SDR family NAD(P)-dependent oxidoreductase [Cohaesibacter sp.]
MEKSKKHVWIIGASSGIGLALAKAYSKAGWSITGSSRNSEVLADLSSHHSSISRLILDVNDENCFQHAIEQFRQSNAIPDLVIYCAATYLPGGLTVLTRNDARHHMETNYLGTIGLIEAITPEFSRRGFGHLAIVASLSGYCGLPNAALYGPTKAALINLCETIKPDYEELGLQLSLINPGFVKTPMTDKNTFSMPFLLTSEEAARAIFKGLSKTSFEISFPWQLSMLLKLLQKVPYVLYFMITKRMQS